jgi:hypothetical protein
MPLVEPESFGGILARIVTAVVVARSALRGYFYDPDGFDPYSPHTGVQRAAEAVYQQLWNVQVFDDLR